MNLSRLLKKPFLILLIASFAIACNPSVNEDLFEGTWTAVTKTAKSCQIIDCGLPGEQITLASDSLSHKGTMDDISFKADHITNENGETVYFPGKDKKFYYRFIWADDQAGITNCEINMNGTKVMRFFVNQTNIGEVKKVKGGSADCVTANETGDTINDSLSIGDGSKVLYIEDDDCLAVRDRQGKQLLDRCFEAFILRIRPVKGNLLPLTFIAGSRSIDIDFYASGNEWISKTATYYRPIGAREEKVTRPYVVSFKDFEFDNIVTQFEKPTDSVADTVHNN
jgi:hypothetical protein